MHAQCCFGNVSQGDVCTAVCKTACNHSRAIEEREQLLLLDHVRNLLPLLCCRIHSGWVVCTGVQQHHCARRRTLCDWAMRHEPVASASATIASEHCLIAARVMQHKLPPSLRSCPRSQGRKFQPCNTYTARAQHLRIMHNVDSSSRGSSNQFASCQQRLYMVSCAGLTLTGIPEDVVVVGPRWVADQNLRACTTAACHVHC